MKHHFIDNFSAGDSFIHKMDAAAKLPLFAIFVAAVAVAPQDSFFFFAACALILSAAFFSSRVPFRHIFRRLVVVVPFVAAAVFTARPLLIFSVAAKSVLCTSAMLLFVSCTKFSDLLRALERFRVPPLFVMVLSFMYRYSFIITGEFERMSRAKLSRTVGGARRFHFRVVCCMAGSLFLRAFERGERVHFAMCARGFDGRIRK